MKDRICQLSLSALAFGLILPAKADKFAIPVDLGPRLEHLAIVEEMVVTFGHARPNLSTELSDAWRVWLRRNPDVDEASEAVKHLAGSPAGDALLYLFHSLQTSLQTRGPPWRRREIEAMPPTPT